MQIIERNHRAIIVLFFGATLLIGLFAADDYGISGDELVNRNNGLMAYRYASGKDRAIMSYRDRYYGTAFELPLVLAERMSGVSDPREIFYLRHLLTFLFFWISTIFFFFLCTGTFGNWRWGLLASVLLTATPRIFAHAFYNSKDVVFMSAVIMGMFTFSRYTERRTVPAAILHALACAFVVDVRVAGLLLVAVTAVLYLAVAPGSKRSFALLIFYLFLTSVFTVAMWPIMWERPLTVIGEALTQMSRFPWDGTVLYLGEYVKADSLPWHYIPVWIAITTPVIYSVLFAAGTFFFAVRVSSRSLRVLPEDRMILCAFCIVTMPVVLSIVMGSVIYDGWRHMFFVYPSFLMIALYGAVSIVRKADLLARRNGRWVFVKTGTYCVICVGIACTVFSMVRMHPYQGIYFNPLAGGPGTVGKNFEMDYWGLSYREALEHIAENDPREKIAVYISSLPGEIGKIPSLMLPPAERARFVFVGSPEEADYFISNYRWHKDEYPYGNEYYSVEIDGRKIAVVYRFS